MRHLRCLARFKLDCGCLGEHGAIFASKSKEGVITDDGKVKEEKRKSTIFYRPFESWGANGEWIQYMLEKEVRNTFTWCWQTQERLGNCRRSSV